MKFTTKNLINFSLGFVLLLFLAIGNKVNAVKVNIDNSEVKVFVSGNTGKDISIKNIIELILQNNVDINSIKSINLYPEPAILMHSNFLSDVDGIEKFTNLENFCIDGLANSETNISKLSRCSKLKNISLNFICTEEVSYYTIINEIFEIPCLVKDDEYISRALEKVLDISSLKCLKLGRRLYDDGNIPAIEKIKDSGIDLGRL